MCQIKMYQISAKFIYKIALWLLSEALYKYFNLFSPACLIRLHQPVAWCVPSL